MLRRNRMPRDRETLGPWRETWAAARVHRKARAWRGCGSLYRPGVTGYTWPGRIADTNAKQLQRVDPLTNERLDELLAHASRVRVLVAGDIMLDRYLGGAATRISPEAPVPVVRVTQEWIALGGAANVASNVVALGASCTLAGVVGNDREAAEIREALRASGIDDAGLFTVAGRPTTVKTRIVARHHQIARYDREVEHDLDAESASRLAVLVRELARDADVLVLEDYNKGTLTRPVIAAAIQASVESGKPLIVDPKSRGFFDYSGATVFKPNLIELESALREPVRADDPVWMERTRRTLGCTHLLVTLGEGGMSLLTESGEFLRVPTVARAVYDVSGAGDTVTAAFAVALGAGATPGEAAVFANHAAGIEVGKPGVATVTPDELRELLRERAASAADAWSHDKP
jgi:D-beta-D-heptose 7-phosphate kinase/D-beta-D-heptose 1-phosphate adenosyltransferase